MSTLQLVCVSTVHATTTFAQAVDNIDATKEALSSAAKQTGSVTVTTAKQLASNAKQVSAETKKLASDTKRSFEQSVQRVEKAATDTQAAVNNAARQVKDGIGASGGDQVTSLG